MQQAERTSGRLGAVFYVSVVVAVLFIVWGVFFSGSLEAFNTAAMGAITESFGWAYLLATTAFIVFLLFLALSRFGGIRLGRDGERPAFSTGAWLAMLFSAGMGIGLVFYGVAEPMSHFGAPPPFTGAEAGTVQSGKLAMQYSFFHWGLHAWAIYGLVALTLAYFQFRRGARGMISAVFYPLLGDRVNGPIGKGIDVLAIFVTTLGVATSFGIGATQINAGANYVFGIPENISIQVLIIFVVMVLFLLSAVSGLNRGIRYLSNVNMLLMMAIMLFVLVAGPTLFIFDSFTAGVGAYAQNFLTMSFTSGAFVGSEGDGWLQSWTVFYWAWWMMWVMWVGTFIARISRGRSIREFVFGVLFVPTLLSAAWFAVLGGTAINEDLYSGGNLAAAAAQNIDTALFVALDTLPLGLIVSVIAMILIGTFFITSADSAAFVLAMLSTEGDENPRWSVKVMWGAFIALFAFVLLLAGGLTAVQNVAIITGVPFTVLLIGMAVSLYKAVAEEAIPAEEGRRRGTIAPGPDNELETVNATATEQESASGMRR